MVLLYKIKTIKNAPCDKTLDKNPTSGIDKSSEVCLPVAFDTLVKTNEKRKLTKKKASTARKNA